MSQILTNLYQFTGWQPYTWFSALVLASLLDALTTIYALRQPGMREANPALRWAMDKIGVVPALVGIKCAPLMCMFYALPESLLYVPPLALVYLAAAGWNAFGIYKNRKANQ